MSIETGRGENPENKNLDKASTLSAKDLVEKIRAGENDLGLDDFQRRCKYATVYGKEGDENPVWNIGDLEGLLGFYKELPKVYDEASDDSMEIVFFNHKGKVPVEESW